MHKTEPKDNAEYAKRPQNGRLSRQLTTIRTWKAKGL